MIGDNPSPARPIRGGSIHTVGSSNSVRAASTASDSCRDRQVTQGALTFAEFAREFSHRLFGAALRLVQKRRPQFGAAGLETCLGITHGGECIIDHALTFMAGRIDHRLGACLGVKQAL